MLLEPKKTAALIVAGMGKDKKPEGETPPADEAEEADASTALESSMMGLTKAIESKDPKAMARALKTAVYLCSQTDDDDQTDED